MKSGPEFLHTLTILFCPTPSHTLYAALTWRPTATLNKTALVHLQLRFEAPNDIVSGSLKWQHIAIIATFSRFFEYVSPQWSTRHGKAHRLL